MNIFYAILMFGFVFCFSVLLLNFISTYNDNNDKSCDEYYHLGLKQGTDYWNLTSEEQMVINKYRMNKVINESMTEEKKK